MESFSCCPHSGQVVAFLDEALYTKYSAWCFDQTEKLGQPENLEYSQGLTSAQLLIYPKDSATVSR